MKKRKVRNDVLQRSSCKSSNTGGESLDLKKRKVTEQDDDDNDAACQIQNELLVHEDGNFCKNDGYGEKHNVAASSSLSLQGRQKRPGQDSDNHEAKTQAIMQRQRNTDTSESDEKLYGKSGKHLVFNYAGTSSSLISSPSSTVDLVHNRNLLLEQHIFNFLRLTRRGSSSKDFVGKSLSSQEDKALSRKIHPNGKSGGTGGDKVDLFGSVLSLSLFLKRNTMTNPSSVPIASTETKLENKDRIKGHFVGSSDDDDSSSGAFASLHDSTSFLLSYLTSSDPASKTAKTCSLFSKTHISGMLLSWSIQSLLNLNNDSSNKASAYEMLMIDDIDVWKTCALCLEMLLVGATTPSECVLVSREESNANKNNLTNNRMNSSTQDEGKDAVLENLGYRLRKRDESGCDSMGKKFCDPQSKQLKIGDKSYQRDDIDNKYQSGGSDAIDDRTSRDVLTSILTNQAAVNKLLSFAAHVGFSQTGSQSCLRAHSGVDDTAGGKVRKSNNNDEGTASIMAARCYSLLIVSEWYRPTMDHVCTTLVPLINNLILSLSSSSSSSSSSSKDESCNTILDEKCKTEGYYSTLSSQTLVRPKVQYHQMVMVEVTLQLIKILQQQRSSNPKKAFGLLSSPQVLSSLARFLQIRLSSSSLSSKGMKSWNSGIESRKKDGDVIVECSMVSRSLTVLRECITNPPATSSLMIPNLIEYILWHGLFHPQLHIDGFRTMNLEVPKGVQEDIIDTSKKGSKGGGISHYCYQQNLLQVLESLIRNKDTCAMSNNSKRQKKMDNLHIIQLSPLLIEGFLQKMAEWGDNLKHCSVVVRNNKKKSTSSPIDSVAKVQFRFFSCVLHPMIEHMNALVQFQTTDTMTQASSNENIEANIFYFLLRSIRQSISLLLKHDAYLPSQNDSGDRHIAYLTMIGETILNLTEGNASIFTFDSYGEIVITEVLFILRDLFLLNHHIFHNKLHRLLKAIAVKSHNYQMGGGNVGKKNRNIACEVFCSICNAYQKLRQLAHFLNAMLSLIFKEYPVKEDPLKEDPLRKDHKDILSLSKSPTILTIFKNNSFLRALSSAIQGSPSEQLQEFYSILKDFISRQVKGGRYRKTNLVSIRFAIDIFVLFLKAVKVQKYSAKTIQVMCDDAMRFTSSNLIVKTRRNGFDPTELQFSNEIDSECEFQLSCAVTNMGIHLSGWIIELHTRCCFWLNQMPHELAVESISHSISDWFGIIPTLIQTTHSVIACQEKALIRSNMGALQHLSCHRVQQLHSLIFQEEQGEVLEGPDNKMIKSKKKSDDMIKEAKHLVNFIIYAACDRTFENDDVQTSGSNGHFQLENDSLTAGWKIVSQNIKTWAPYSKLEHTTMFLEWFFLTLSVEDKDLNNSEANKVMVDRLKDPVPCSVFYKDRSVALALLHDTSFFEIKEICNNCVNVGLRCASELIAHALADVGKHDSFKLYGIEIAIPLNLQQMPLTSIQLENIMKSKKCKEVEIDLSKVFYFLERSLNILLTLNRIIRQSMLNCESSCVMDTMLRLHETMCNLLRTLQNPSPTHVDSLLRMISTCRATFSANLCGLTDNRTFLTPADAPYIRNLVLYIFNSSRDCIDAANSVGIEKSKTSIAAINWGGKLIGELFSFCLRIIGLDRSQIKSFLSTLGTIVKVVDKPTLSEDVLLKVNTIRPVVIKMIDNNRCASHKMITRDLYSLVEDSVFLPLLQASLIEIMDAMNKKSFDVHFEDAVVFVADTLHLDRIYSIANKSIRQLGDDGTVEKILTSVLGVLEGCISSTLHSDTLKSATLYFLCSVSISQRQPISLSEANLVTQVQSLVMLHYIHDHGRVDPLLDSAYSELLSHTSEHQIILLSENLRDAVKNLNQISDHQVISASVYCFRIMILVVTEEAQKRLLANICQFFLYLVFEILSSLSLDSHISNTEWENNLCSSILFLCTVVERKDIIKLTSSEVSTALGSVNNIFQLKSGNKSKRPVDSKAFLSSCELMLMLLKRYTGQLYSCPPVFICAFRSLFIYIMKTKIKRCSHHNVMSCNIKSFTKLCEALPAHKEVFKKHVATLIFDYIDALQDDMDFDTKTQLIPAVHMLLDTLTIHETRQMNVMMNLSSKAMFQIVHQQYQQKHVYKGQF